MKFSDFKNSLESGEQFSVYLFEGEDAFFKQRGASLLKDKYILEPSLNLQEFEGEEENLDGIIASLLAYPFMSDKRMTLVKEFYPKKNEVASLEQILENPSKESLFVILHIVIFVWARICVSHLLHSSWRSARVQLKRLIRVILSVCPIPETSKSAIR